jgi:hypothetical protein
MVRIEAGDFDLIYEKVQIGFGFVGCGRLQNGGWREPRCRMRSHNRAFQLKAGPEAGPEP